MKVWLLVTTDWFNTMLTEVQEFCGGERRRARKTWSSLDLITHGNLEQIHSIPVKADYIWHRKYFFFGQSSPTHLKINEFGINL